MGPAFQEAVKAVAEVIGDTGRILVRESGMEMRVWRGRKIPRGEIIQ